MIEALKNAIVSSIGRHLGVLVCAMLPVVELRGSIPLGAFLELPWWENYLFSVLGNMIPVPFILLFINKLIIWMGKSKVGFIRRFGEFLTRKAEKNKERIAKYSFFGVCIFVAIPLPITGAWTGSLVAAALGMNFWKALLSCFLGVLIAGVIMTLASYGVVAAFGFFA